MTELLEIKERIKNLYSKYEVFILPVVKFLLAFIVLNMLNGKMGYMTKLDNIAIVLIVALMCSFLPNGCIVLFGVLFSLLHMYALSLEAAVVGLCVYMVVFLLVFRLGAGDTILVVLTPLLCAMKIPYVIPVVAGLFCTPASALPVGCGVVVYYLLRTVVAGSSTINAMEDTEFSAKLRLLIDGIIRDKAMMVTIASFAITILVVYLIRRMSIDYAWSIAMIAGAMTDIVILLIGDLIYDTNISLGGALLGSILAVAVAKVLEFFARGLDYRRTEKVQFEDDEYYYYVKAVPKMTLVTPEKTVKRINHSRYATPDERRVMTERTVAERPERHGNQGAGRGGRDYRNSGRSITVGTPVSEPEDVEADNDFEELF
ncbi:MAG: hypothetical protein ACI4HQ_08670 [Acetatifactor sp.]